MWGLSLVVASGGHSSSRCAGLSLSRPLLLRGTGSRHAGSVVVAHGPSRSAACGIFPDQGSNPCPLHWQADSQPLRHQGSPVFFISISFISALIFMISFLLLTLGFLCSSFSSCFRCRVRLFIWDFSCSLRWDWIAIIFPLRTALAASHRFGSLCFRCHLFLCIFLFLLWFLQWSLVYLVAHCLTSMCLCFLCFFPL